MSDVLNCKRCGGKILVTGYCSQCGLKSEYVNKALNTSKYYYNIGLDKARVRDMTGAEEALKIALKYDKVNIDARNLLGLIYYETGEVVLALSHWVISVNYFDGRNAAKRYIKEVKSSPHKLDAANNVARKYNQALAYAKQGSKDLAYIQLRKVISDNPHFVKGYLLLALLFIDDNKFDKARRALKRVIKIDRTNPLAVRYYNEMGHTDEEIMNFRDYPSEDFDRDALFGEKPPRAYDEGDEIPVTGEKTVPVGRYKDINFYKYSIAYVLSGLFLGIAVMWFLVLPGREKKHDSDSRDIMISYSEEIANKNTTISSLEDEVSSLTNKVNTLSASVTEYEKKQKAELSQSDKVVMQLALKYYEESDFDKALVELDKVLKNAPSYDAALYYKAMCYEGMEDEDKAEDIFKVFLEKCPDSIYYTVVAAMAGDVEDIGNNKPEDSSESGEGAQDDASTEDISTEDTSSEDISTENISSEEDMQLPE